MPQKGYSSATADESILIKPPTSSVSLRVWRSVVLSVCEMVPSRNGPKGALLASFGLASLTFILTPTQVGYQDVAALIAQQPAVAARSREHLIASPFGTIHAAMFSMPRPIGTAIPETPLVHLASLSVSMDVTGSIGANADSARPTQPQLGFPTINRTNKGDRLVPGIPPQPEPASEDGAATSPPVQHPSILPVRPKAAEIDHSEDDLPDAQ